MFNWKQKIHTELVETCEGCSDYVFLSTVDVLNSKINVNISPVKKFTRLFSQAHILLSECKVPYFKLAHSCYEFNNCLVHKSVYFYRKHLTT